jgi:hypothetical protein
VLVAVVVDVVVVVVAVYVVVGYCVIVVAGGGSVAAGVGCVGFVAGGVVVGVVRVAVGSVLGIGRRERDPERNRWALSSVVLAVVDAGSQI